MPYRYNTLSNMLVKLLRKSRKWKDILWGCLALVLVFMQEARADELPDAASISGVVGHPQSYSLSCEARSAVDWMAFWGVSVSEADFLAELPRSDNPDRGFVGHASDVWGNIPPRSYGVHAEPVADLLREYGFEVEGQRDLSWDDLRREVASGRPVIVWVIGQMWRGTPRSYVDSEGHNTIVASFEHTMILTGYDEASVYVVDAFSGLNLTFSRQAFLDSWAVLGNMAVTGYRSQAEDGGDSKADMYGEDTYIVQRGDYLVALADRFGTTWQELAALNDIRYPYIIYPGQVLKVPRKEKPAEPPAQPEPTPTLEPSPPPKSAPTVTPRPLQPGEVRSQIYLPQICQDCQVAELKRTERGRPRLRVGR